MPPPPVLMEELLEEVFFRLLPDEPAWLVRASAVCKPWRRILADRGFRRRYREFHRTPPVLGLFEKLSPRLVPIPALFPAQPDHPGWYAMDCRHGRALFADIGKTEDLMVLDPMTGLQRRVPSPSNNLTAFTAAVLCASQGCDHHDCQDRHFLVAVVCGKKLEEITLGWLYSSETDLWTELNSVHNPDVLYGSYMAAPSVLVGDALYFNVDDVSECQLGTLRLSMFKKPIDHSNGILMTAEDGGLGFAAVVDAANLTLWSREAGPKGAMGWTTLRVIDLKMLLPDGDLSITSFTTTEYMLAYAFRCPWLSGFVEGTQVIFVTTSVGSYMVDLKAGRARKVCDPGIQFFPFMSFYIPAMEAASTSQGQ